MVCLPDKRSIEFVKFCEFGGRCILAPLNVEVDRSADRPVGISPLLVLPSLQNINVRTAFPSWTKSFRVSRTLFHQAVMGKENFQEDSQSDVSSTPQLLFPETDLSQGIVGWDGQKDHQNPK